MLYGKGKPKLQLRSNSGSSLLERTFEYPVVCEPEFTPDDFIQTAIDGSRYRYVRGWWVKVALDFDCLSDTEYADLMTMMRDQSDFESSYGKTKFIRLYPHVDNTNEFWDGQIVSPIKHLNEYFQLTHGAKIVFEGNKRLAKTEICRTGSEF